MHIEYGTTYLIFHSAFNKVLWPSVLCFWLLKLNHSPADISVYCLWLVQIIETIHQI